MLVKTSLNESQVMYGEPAKYVAKQRALNAGAPATLFKINLDAGHGCTSGRYDYLRERLRSSTRGQFNCKVSPSSLGL
jgi:oligopeptidase B